MYVCVFGNMCFLDDFGVTISKTIAIIGSFDHFDANIIGYP
jgi:hypothetical protein